MFRKAFLLALSVTYLQADEPLTRISCGSCYKPSHDQDNIWKTIADKTNPQVFLFMGDNIYADTHDMDFLKKEYQVLLDHKGYKEFSSKTKILPIWDDHDYAINDAGEEHPEKKESQKIFQDTFKFPADHPSRKTPGIYHSYVQGKDGQRVQILSLDTRYFRSTLIKGRVNGRKGYLPNNDPKATMLGDAQWKWLEEELKKPADLRIIVSSIQIITTEHRFEKWSNLPLERQRFIDLLKKTKANNVILLAGDRHCAEIAKMPKSESGLSYDLYEMTSSGMTHAGAPKDSNKHRVGEFVRENNFGSILIDWSQKTPTTTFTIHNKNGTPLVKQVVRFE